MALVTATDALTAASTHSAVSGAAAQLIVANTERNGLRVTIDPAGTGPVYLTLGVTVPSATSFDVVLSPGQYWDGLISRCVWRGAVQVFGTGARVSVTEV